MTQTLPAPTDPVVQTETPKSPRVRGPSRLELRRRLLLWSTPVLVLLLLLAVKMASVGILGNKLPGQFAARDQAGMESTLGWIDVGNVGPGYKEQLAAGDMLILGGDLQAAFDQFKSAHAKERGACPPRGNFALASEKLSDQKLKDGSFATARTLLEPAVQAVNDDKDCFASFSSPVADVDAFVAQTPERLSNKLAALKAGNLTKTANGYDYIRTPGGGIDITPAPGTEGCPFEGDEAKLRDCINKRDAERDRKQAEAEQKAAADRQAQNKPPADPNQPPPPPPPPQAPPPSQAPAPPTDPEIRFPRPPEMRATAPPGEGEPTIPLCSPDGTPLGDLQAALCKTSGPLP